MVGRNGCTHELARRYLRRKSNEPKDRQLPVVRLIQITVERHNTETQMPPRISAICCLLLQTDSLKRVLATICQTEKALRLGRRNSYGNCLASLIRAPTRHKVLFSARVKIRLVEIVCPRLSQKRAIESIGRRY
jgi:hypothetical protein